MKFWIYCVLREACCQEAVFYCPVWGMLRTENPLVIPVSDAAAPGIVSGEITWGSGLTLWGETGMFWHPCPAGPCCARSLLQPAAQPCEGAALGSSQPAHTDALSTAGFSTQRRFLFCTRPGFPKGNKRVWGLLSGCSSLCLCYSGLQGCKCQLGVSKKLICPWPLVRAVLPGVINSSDKQYSKFLQSE